MMFLYGLKIGSIREVPNCINAIVLEYGFHG